MTNNQANKADAAMLGNMLYAGMTALAAAKTPKGAIKFSTIWTMYKASFDVLLVASIAISAIAAALSYVIYGSVGYAIASYVVTGVIASIVRRIVIVRRG